MSLKGLRRKGEEVSRFSFNALLGMSFSSYSSIVSCSNLLEPNFLNSFCKLDKIALVFILFLECKYARTPLIFM